MSAQGGNDVFHGFAGVAVVDPVALCQKRTGWRFLSVCAYRRVNAIGDDRPGEVLELVVRHENVGEAERYRVGAVELGSRQRGVMTEQSGRARQDEGAAHVGD